MQPFQVPETALQTMSQPSQSVLEMRLGSMLVRLVRWISSSPMMFRIRAMAESTESAGLSRRLETREAFGGMTLGALLPDIWVKATVVRSKALSSPPCFLVSRFSTQPKAQRFEKIMRYRKLEWRPRVSNIFAAGAVRCIRKGCASTFAQAMASLPTGVWGPGAEA